jgi:hypothetical protein
MHTLQIFALLWLGFVPQLTAQVPDSLFRLENEFTALEINPLGGAIVGFTLKENPVNPLSWAAKAAQMPPNNQAGAPFQGHFLCIGRWGSPTEGEKAMGVPHNGDHNNRLWRIAEQQEHHLQIQVEAPADGFHLERTVRLEPGAAVFHVQERVVNTRSSGRLSNVVQHPTLGPPFLNAETRINSNAGDGFLQKLAYPDPSRHAFRWPLAIRDSSGTAVDLRRSDLPHNYVSTHVFDDSVEQGWITAYSPRHKLVYGFVWETEDYPWLNLWHHSQEGQPVAKGLEFGTAGIGRPYQELLARDCRFRGHNSFEFHDAGEVKEKRYTCFLLPVSSGFEEVVAVQRTASFLLIQGKGGENYRLPLQESQ